MATEPAAPLSGLLVRRGAAKPTNPELAVNEADQATSDARRLVSDVEAMPSAAPEEASGHGQGRGGALRPVPPQTLDRRPLNVRVPLSHAEGLRIMMHFTRRAAQDLMTEFLEDGLNRWNPEWRSLLP